MRLLLSKYIFFSEVLFYLSILSALVKKLTQKAERIQFFCAKFQRFKKMQLYVESERHLLNIVKP